jgi:phospholipase C
MSDDVPETASRSAGLTRRRMFGRAAAVGGLAAASLALPVNVRKAIAAGNPQHGQLSDIKHVVMLMQENRSFDHYFGTLSGVRGFDDPHAIRLPDGKPVWYQPDPDNPDGYLLPYRLNSRMTAAQAIPSMSHAWNVQHQSWDDGKMDQWIPAHRAVNGASATYGMGYFTRDDIPFQYALADAFTVCDGYHCSVLGPTQPNRMMWMSGTVDPNGDHGGPMLDNNTPVNTFSWTTYPERLAAAGVSWRIYHDPGDVTGLNLLNEFQQYYSATAGNPLYDNGLAATPIGRFEYDALNDSLPTVSWILPPVTNDEHPARLPAAGADFVASIVDAIAANPEVWAKTVFILSYDENDGFFDHVVPHTAPPGTPDEIVTKTSATGVDGAGWPVGLGFRVPAIVVSPCTVGGWVCSETFDHTSQLRLLERVTGVQETNISDWRRQAVGDMTSVFQFSHPSSDVPKLPGTGASYNLAQYEVSTLPLPTVPTNQQPPHQEHGGRHHT